MSSYWMNAENISTVIWDTINSLCKDSLSTSSLTHDILHDEYLGNDNGDDIKTSHSSCYLTIR